MEHLLMFGCIVYIKNTRTNPKKLDDRSPKMVFVGYEKGSKAYRAYDPHTGCVPVTRELFEFVVTDTTMYHEQVVDQVELTPIPSSPVNPVSASPPTPENDVHTMPPSTRPDLDADHDEDAPLRFCRIDNVLGPAAMPGLAMRALQQELHAVSAEEPGSLEEAAGDPSWRAAMVEELCSIEENGTWEVADLSAGHKVIDLKWVYKAKKDQRGCIIKHKAHLVAKGYVQKQGVDFDEVFTPVTRMETLQLILAVAAHEGWIVRHMGIKSTFLNAELTEEVYVHQSPGAVDKGEQLLKLHKEFYGLRQAPRAWYLKLHSSLNSASRAAIKNMQSTPGALRADHWWSVSMLTIY
jgi:hypothetical protein